MDKHEGIFKRVSESYVLPFILFLIMGVSMGLRLVDTVLISYDSQISSKLLSTQRVLDILSILLLVCSIPSMKKYFPKASRKEGVLLIIGIFFVYFAVAFALRHM